MKISQRAQQISPSATIGMWSKLVPQADDMLIDAAINLINQRA